MKSLSKSKYLIEVYFSNNLRLGMNRNRRALHGCLLSKVLSNVFYLLGPIKDVPPRETSGEINDRKFTLSIT